MIELPEVGQRGEGDVELALGQSPICARRSGPRSLGADGDRVLARRGVQPLDVAAVAPDAHQRLEPVELREHLSNAATRRRSSAVHAVSRSSDPIATRARSTFVAAAGGMGRRIQPSPGPRMRRRGKAEDHGTIVTCIDLYVTLLVSGLSSTTPKASAWG